MRPITIILLTCAATLSACQKKETGISKPLNAPVNHGSGRDHWEATMYRNKYVVPPNQVLYSVQPTTQRAGTARFEITDGKNFDTEEVDYEISADRKSIRFTHTYGNINTLSSNGQWTITRSEDEFLDMESEFGVQVAYKRAY